MYSFCQTVFFVLISVSCIVMPFKIRFIVTIIRCNKNLDYTVIVQEMINIHTHMYTPTSGATYGVFFPTKKCALYYHRKMQFCFLKMFRPLKGWYFPMVEGIAFYVRYKSSVLIIPCKAENFCLFIELPDEIYKKAPGIVIQFWS